MPKVSIIIPTLNRAHLLCFALKSAVEQDYQDLEIVVCDDFSDDNTKETVESFQAENIVYVRTPKRLNMTDSFEFALSKAKGEYLTFPTDAMYLMPYCISYAISELKRNNVQLAMWKNCVYCYSDWMEKVRRNTLQIPSFTFKTYLIGSKSALEKFYNNIREPIIPKSINSLCHRSIIEKAMKIQEGHFFSQPVPDHTSAVSLLINTDKFIFIDKPLSLGSLSSANIGASQSFNLGKSAQEFLKGFEGKKMEEIAFLGIYTTASLIIKGLENVRRFYPDCPEINMKNALLEIVDSLAKLQVYGAQGIENYWRIFDDYIERHYKNLKTEIFFKKIKSLLKWKGVRMMRSNHFFHNFESIIRGMKILRGEKYGFNNIEEAAKVVDAFNKQK
jgi:glycosyltransferase involved in cell wall biosynthesis